MSQRHIVVDLETLGNDVRTGPILAIGACAFDFESAEDPIESPLLEQYIGGTGLQTSVRGSNFFYTAVGLKTQLEQFGCVIDHETLAWWLDTERRPLFSDMLSMHHSMNLEVALFYFKLWIEGHRGARPKDDVFLWSHGATYDCMHLMMKWPVVMNHEQLSDVVPFRNIRDTRTLFAVYKAKFGADVHPGFDPIRKHHALEDAWLMARSIKRAYLAITKGVM